MSMPPVNRKWVLLTAVLLLLLVRLAIWRDAPPGETGQWYYDTETRKLFLHDRYEPYPITAPSGGQGVLAIVFACGACSDPDTRFVGYLEKFIQTDDDGTVPPDPAADSDHLVARVQEPLQWVPFNRPASRDIINMADRCPSGQPLTQCRPDTESMKSGAAP